MTSPAGIDAVLAAAGKAVDTQAANRKAAADATPDLTPPPRDPPAEPPPDSPTGYQ